MVGALQKERGNRRDAEKHTQRRGQRTAKKPGVIPFKLVLETARQKRRGSTHFHVGLEGAGGFLPAFQYNNFMTTCILFDIDGTLLASGGAGKAALETTLCEDFQRDLRVAVPYAGRTDRAIARDLFLHHDLADTPENWHKLVAGYLRRLPAHLESKNGHVLPGIHALLAALQHRGDVALGLLTGNTRAGARTKLGHYQLFDHFAFGGFGDHHLDRDDVARDAWAAAREQCGNALTPERTWVIGDSPLDVRCARAIGARAVAVATGGHAIEQLLPHGADLTLNNLADPMPLLALLP
jgi:phosphoglycolate phosphatase-like HAD superfamily hydrolase